MSTTQRLVVAVFDDRAQAEQAVNALENTGFSGDQIRFAGHGASSGGILDSLKSLFTGQDTGSVYNDLVSMGMPQDDASYFQREYEAGRSIVTVLAGGRMQEATALLARYGGYAANRRSAQTAGTAATSGTGVQETGTEGEQQLRLREEQVTVEKQPYVREEVAMGKRPVQETKQVSDTVRREEAHVERAGDVNVQGSDVEEVSDQSDQPTP